MGNRCRTKPRDHTNQQLTSVLKSTQEKGNFIVLFSLATWAKGPICWCSAAVIHGSELNCHGRPLTATSLIPDTKSVNVVRQQMKIIAVFKNKKGHQAQDNAKTYYYTGPETPTQVKLPALKPVWNAATPHYEHLCRRVFWTPKPNKVHIQNWDIFQSLWMKKKSLPMTVYSNNLHLKISWLSWCSVNLFAFSVLPRLQMNLPVMVGRSSKENPETQVWLMARGVVDLQNQTISCNTHHQICSKDQSFFLDPWNIKRKWKTQTNSWWLNIA